MNTEPTVAEISERELIKLRRKTSKLIRKVDAKLRPHDVGQKGKLKTTRQLGSLMIAMDIYEESFGFNYHTSDEWVILALTDRVYKLLLYAWNNSYDTGDEKSNIDVIFMRTLIKYLCKITRWTGEDVISKYNIHHKLCVEFLKVEHDFSQFSDICSQFESRLRDYTAVLYTESQLEDNWWILDAYNLSFIPWIVKEDIVNTVLTALKKVEKYSYLVYPCFKLLSTILDYGNSNNTDIENKETLLGFYTGFIIEGQFKWKETSNGVESVNPYETLLSKYDKLKLDVETNL